MVDRQSHNLTVIGSSTYQAFRSLYLYKFSSLGMKKVNDYNALADGSVGDRTIIGG